MNERIDESETIKVIHGGSDDDRQWLGQVGKSLQGGMCVDVDVVRAKLCTEALNRFAGSGIRLEWSSDNADTCTGSGLALERASVGARPPTSTKLPDSG